MFRKLIKNKKAQNTAEYALLISLVVAAIIAMQTYAQRALQARVRDAAQYMATTISGQANGMNATLQYEPYYLTSNYQVTSDSSTTQILGNQLTSQVDDSTRTRGDKGFQESSYNAALVGNVGL